MKKDEKYIIEIAEVHTHYDDNGKAFPVARIKGFSSLVFDQKGLDKLERIIELKSVKKKELYNCKFIVTDFNGALGLTRGKIYELKNGKFYDDKNHDFPVAAKIYSFKDLEEYFKHDYSQNPVEILEIKE